MRYNSLEMIQIRYIFQINHFPARINPLKHNHLTGNAGALKYQTISSVLDFASRLF